MLVNTRAWSEKFAERAVMNESTQDALCRDHMIAEALTVRIQYATSLS